MAEKSPIQCPLCGNKVPPGVTKCPVCATDLRGVAEKAPAKGSPRGRPAEDFLHREIPKVVLPEAKHTCPLCALELVGKETKCPRCGVPLSTGKGEEMLECPDCGTLAPFGSKSCPRCGIGFAEIPKPPPAKRVPPPPQPVPVVPVPPQRPVPERPSRIEAVAPVPPTAPPPSRGLTNGRGATNGTGLVNGTGMVNGTKGEVRLKKVKERRLFLARWQFLAVLIAVVMVISTFMYLSYARQPRLFAVDGDFGEWSDVDRFGAYAQASSASIAIMEWAVASEGSRLFLYVNTEGAIMGSTDVDSYYLFVDSDNSTSTGYNVSGIGADYLLQLDGWNRSVQSTTLSEYSSTSDMYDWNSWKSIGTVSSASAGNELEAMADLSVPLNHTTRFMLMAQNNLEEHSVSYTVPEKGGLLAVEVEKGTGVQLGGLVARSANVSMMKLRLVAEGESGTIRSLSPTITGASLVSTIQDISLVAGQERVVEVLVDTSSAATASLVTAYVRSEDVQSTFMDIQVIGSGVRAYVDSPPSEIQIDGAFADWTGKTTSDSDAITQTNPNIDIDAVGAVNGTSYSAFYVSVVGEMCNGSRVPVIKEKPSGGGGGGAVYPTRKTGEDVLDIYIDSDADNSSGKVVSLSSKVIGADYLLEIRGVNGDIVSRSLKIYDGSSWGLSSGTVNVSKDDQQLEVSVASSSIGGSSSIDFIVETTDWRQRNDLATAVPLGTKSLVGGLLSGASILSWPVESPTNSATATAMSYQRKLVYDGANYWSFYFDGNNTVYRYSTDFGRTWTVGGQVFSSLGVDEASVWYHSATGTIYVVGDISTASRSVYVRQGTVVPSSQTINWDGSDSQPVVSTVALGGKNTYISSDSAGYVWIVSSNCTQPAPVRYQLSVFRSSVVNSTSAWEFVGNLLPAGGDPGQGVKGSIVNVGTGTTMYAVFGYSGNVSAMTYTGVWSVEDKIYSIGTANPGNTDNAPPCVAVDGKGVAHIVYGNGHEQKSLSKPYIYYVYYNGARSSPPTRLDTLGNTRGNMYPTVSVDSSAGNVFAFWVETDTNAVPLTIVGKKNASGTWSFVTIGGDATYTKRYLNSIYSAPNENLICWQWTQNTTAGVREVQFDNIPEFSDIALPLLEMVALVLFVPRIIDRRRMGNSKED